MGCCCGACYKRLNCENSGGVDSCCNCLPFRLCVTIAESEYDENAVSKMFELDCSLGLLYSSNIVYRELPIDLTFQHKLDSYGGCVFCLSSTAMESIIGDELCVSLGDYSSERSALCSDPNFEFTVDLSSLIYGAGDVTITVTKMPIVSRPVQETGEVDCTFQQICLKLVEYGVTTKVFACRTEDQWIADINGNEVVVNLDSTNPVTLSVTGDLGSGYPVEAECPGMLASWDLGSGKLYVRGNSRVDCVDCLCWAKNLCILYQDDGTGDSAYGSATWVDGYGWVMSDNLDYLGIGLVFVCNECTGTTTLAVIGFEEYGSEVVCPNLDTQITVPGHVYGGGFTLIIDPAACNDCPTQASSGGPNCCPDGVPATLYGTFSDGGGLNTCSETFPSIEFNWQPVSDGCNSTPIDDIGYAYRSEEFNLSDGPHRLFLVPCSGDASCTGEDAAWEICDSIGTLFDGLSNCNPCSGVDMEFTAECPSDPADAVIKITITE